jgi:probable F420-dependent oxidoreductase
MRIGIASFFGSSARRDFGFVAEFAACAEELGFSTLYSPEHVVFFESYDSKYPYSPDGSAPWGGRAELYDPLFVCAAAALATTTLRFATSVLILPERPALLAAKEVMTLDHLSKGRFDLGIGIGWSKEEFEALDMPWDHRGKRCDEYMEAMRCAWQNDPASYKGRYVNFENVVLRPQPVNGTVPIIVGGDSTAAMRRAARLGDGWYGWWAAGEIEPHVEEFRSIMAAEGREHDDRFDLRIGVPITRTADDGDTLNQVAAKAGRAEAVGADEFVIGPPVPAANFEDQLRRWAEALIP